MSRKEHSLGRKIYMWNSIYTFLVDFVPPLIILIILLIDLGSKEGGKFINLYVYSIISYIGNIKGPLNRLPSTIVLLVRARVSCKRIDHLLAAENADSLTTGGLAIGHIKIDNLSGSWETQTSYDHAHKRYRYFSRYERIVRQRKQMFKNENKAENRLDTQDPQSANILRLSAVSSTTRRDYDVLFRVPFKIQLNPGKRLFILNEQETKFSLVDAFLGHLHISGGSLQYGGRIGYIPEAPYLQVSSIKDNILLGLSMDEVKYKRIVTLLGLNHVFNCLHDMDQVSVNLVSGLLSITDKQKIILARALYQGADIILFDNSLDDMNMHEVIRLLNLFESHPDLRDKTLVISTRSRKLMRPQDKILIMKNNTGKEFGNWTQLIRNQDSYLRSWEVCRTQFGITKTESPLKIKKTQSRNVKAQTINNDLKKKQQDEWLKQTEITDILPRRQKPITPLDERFPRVTGVPLAQYWEFLKDGKISAYAIVFILLALGQAANIFSVWWIGQARIAFPNLSTANSVVVYILLILFYGATIFACGLMMQFISVRNLQTMGPRIFNQTQHSDVEMFLVRGKLYFIMLRYARDIDQIFMINNEIMQCFSSIMFYIGIIVIGGIQAWPVFIIGGIVFVLNIIVVLIYMRAERQMKAHRYPFRKHYFNIIENVVFGHQSIRVAGSEDYMRRELMESLYFHPTVHRMNYRWAFGALSICSDLLGLITTFTTVSLSIRQKLFSHSSASGLATSIVLSNRLSTISSTIAKGVSRVEVLFRNNVSLPKRLVGKSFEKEYDKPSPPSKWPMDSSVEFQRVTYSHSEFIVPSLRELSFKWKTGSKIAVFDGARDTAIESLVALICRLRWPTPNPDSSLGQIIIGKSYGSQLGIKYIRQQVKAINNFPFIMNTTLRENLDPFRKHSDTKLREVLEKVDLWQSLPQPNIFITGTANTSTKLDYELNDSGIDLPVSSLQLLNFARIMLDKPKIFLAQQAFNALNPYQRERIRTILTGDEFKDVTVILETHDVPLIEKFGRVITFHNGKIAEDGDPLELAKDKKNWYRKILKGLNYTDKAIRLHQERQMAEERERIVMVPQVLRKTTHQPAMNYDTKTGSLTKNLSDGLLYKNIQPMMPPPSLQIPSNTHNSKYNRTSSNFLSVPQSKGSIKSTYYVGQSERQEAKFKNDEMIQSSLTRLVRDQPR